MWALSSPTRNQTCVPCTSRQILNYWTTREVTPPPPQLFWGYSSSCWNILFYYIGSSCVSQSLSRSLRSNDLKKHKSVIGLRNKTPCTSLCYASLLCHGCTWWVLPYSHLVGTVERIWCVANGYCLGFKHWVFWNHALGRSSDTLWSTHFWALSTNSDSCYSGSCVFGSYFNDGAWDTDL